MFRHINKVVKVLVVVDFFYNSALASFAPIFAIFITDSIVGGSASVVGFATACYWITKSIFQLPIARFLDRTDGEKDDFWAMFFGYILVGLIPIAYVFASVPWHLYLIQILNGFLMAWVVPAWYAIFTRHVDKWRISFEWSLESVFSVGLANAGAAALGGILVDRVGFDALYIGASCVAVASSFLLLGLRKHLLQKGDLERVLPERRVNRQ
ncbi:MAG: MFS transporter [Patescibacteria group bacterium]